MKKFTLSSTDRKIGGVCGGLAEYFGIDPLIVRLGVVLAFFGYGVGLLFYILLWILAPRD